jgi:hypothetical protein
LELFGTIALAGVDVIAPAECAGDELWSRVVGSVLRDAGRLGQRRARVQIQAATAWRGAPRIRWKTEALIETLSTIVEVQNRSDEPPSITYPPSPIQHPLVPNDPDPFRAEILLSNWTVDDAAWIAEVVYGACNRIGITQDVLVGVRQSDAKN